ncbi:hypothetical protein YC2023_111015 [Brassica napus]
MKRWWVNTGPDLNRSPSNMCLGPDENIDILEPIIFHKEHVALLYGNGCSYRKSLTIEAKGMASLVLVGVWTVTKRIMGPETESPTHYTFTRIKP